MPLRSRPDPSAPYRAGAVAWKLLLAALAVGMLATVGAPRAGAAPGAADRAAHRARHAAGALLLDDQTQWVQAPKAGTAGTGPSGGGASGAPAPSGASGAGPSVPSARFDLELTARDAPARAAIEVVLYPRLRSRYALETDVREGPRGDPLSSTTPVAYRTLPPEPGSATTASLDLSVVQTSSTGQPARIGLDCAPPTGSGTCTGVYPVVVELQRSTGKVLHRLTTFLTYVTGRSAHPLELAWVVPVAAPVALSPRPAAPTAGVEPLTPARASALETLVAALRASAVPVTLDVSPETLQGLRRAGSKGRATVTALSSLSGDQARDEVLSSPYVPIDLGALAGAGEPGEVAAQMSAGGAVLRRFHVETSGPSPWVQRGRVGRDVAAGLSEVGASQLVLPEADLAATTGTTDVGTWVSTFPLRATRRGSGQPVDAAETDTWLDAQFASQRDDPGLAATQVLADLAMVYFERPNTPAVRGLVALPSASWTADPVFTDVLVGNLPHDPVVEPVTLSRFFGSVTPGATRALATPRAEDRSPRPLVRATQRARVRLSEFADAVAKRPAVLGQLDDLLLASEAENLGARRQAAAVTTVEHLLSAQLGLVQFARSTVTLTARTGWIPVTIQSSAPYTLVGTLSVSGNKFVFPHKSHALTMKLDHATNLSRVDVLARTSGDLPLRVTFTSPDGALVIARGVLTVRSTATSVVGVVLTALALAVLLVWWARTWRSGRRKRRGRANGRPAAGASAPGAHGAAGTTAS